MISVLPVVVKVTLVAPWEVCEILISFGLGTVACFTTLGSVVLFLLSVAFAVTFPFGIGRVGLIVTRPFKSVVPWPNSVPAWSYNLTVEPGSAETVIGVLVSALSVNEVSITGLFWIV